MAIRLASVWIILFVLPLTCANFTDVCNETYSNTKGLQCFPCSPGYTKKDDCRTNHTLAQCTQCNEGTYQPHCISANETGECRNCTLCAVYIKHCTIYKNSVCGRKNSTEDTSEEKGYKLRMVVLYLCGIQLSTLSIICIGLYCSNCRYRKCIKPATNNKRNSDEFTDLLMLRGDTNHGVGRKGECIRTYTATESEASRLLESTESTKDESQVIKTKDVSEEKNRKLSKESKPTAVISPVNGVGVNNNRYGGLQLTRERLQFSGDSENTPKENTNNKGPANNGTHAENQIVHVKELAESEEKGAANTEIDWLKLFRDLATLLPIDECSWTFFAIDLLQISREQCGLPKDVDNEKNKIKHNKQLDLAYFDLLNTWYSMMGSEASLKHIESALKRMNNKIILEEFERIKDNPPTRKIFARNTETSLMPWRQIEQFPQTQRQLLAFAQHENTQEITETHGRLSHKQGGHFVQFTNFSTTSQNQTSKPFLSDQSGLVRQNLQQRSKEKYYENDPCHKVRRRGSKIKKRSSRRKSKMEKKLKIAEEMRKLETENSSLKHENITLIKTILPFDNIHLSRQQYNTFLVYTVNKIMEHNYVSRKTVLLIPYEAYTEIAETKNGGRYILYSGSPKLKLDKEQYDCLVFYVKFARTRVLKEIEELQDNGDTLFLFITYDGKSAFELYQRQSRLKKRRNLLNSFEPDYCFCSSGSSSSETESSDVHDIETGEGLRSQIHTSSASSSMYDDRVNDFCVETYNLPTISENNEFLKNKHTVSTHQNESYSATIYSRRRRNEEIEENHDCNDNEDITVVKGLPESVGLDVENEMSAECIPVEDNRNQAMSEPLCTRNRDIANHNNGVQENDSEMSFEDLMKDIDKELACATFM